MSLFTDFNFLPSLQTTLTEKALKIPNKIQESTIPLLLEERTGAGASETESGKTLAYALPRAVESDPRHKAIEMLLKGDCKPLWEKSSLKVALIPLFPSLEACLKALLGRKHVERGLERIEQVLGNEQKGLLALQEKQGGTPSHRVSRLLILSNDGSERFYRSCEKLLLQHKNRVLLLILNEPSTRLAEIFLKEKDKTLKAILVSDRDAVSSALVSLVESVQDG